jgi:hypothetical protein
VALDTAEYFPTAHSVQVLAPGALPVLVIEPAAHAAHADTFDAAEYSPAAHAVQVIAPTSSPMPVIEPAWQSAQ